MIERDAPRDGRSCADESSKLALLRDHDAKVLWPSAARFLVMNPSVARAGGHARGACVVFVEEPSKTLTSSIWRPAAVRVRVRVRPAAGYDSQHGLGLGLGLELGLG